jgi:hypothetical protein
MMMTKTNLWNHLKMVPLKSFWKSFRSPKHVTFAEYCFAMLIYISKYHVLLRNLLSNKILICSVCRSFPHSWFITRFVTRATRRVPHVVQELSSHPEHMNSPSVSIEVHVTPSLVFYVMFCRSLFYVLSFYFVCHGVFRPCSIYAF